MTLSGPPNTRFRCSNGVLYATDGNGYVVVTDGADRQDLLKAGCMDLSLSPTGTGGFVTEYSKYWGGYRIS